MPLQLYTHNYPTHSTTRAGIPGVAGRLGLPAKTIMFWKRASLFVSRISAKKKKMAFFRLLGVCFVLFGGVFCAFGGCFGGFCFFCFSRAARNLFGGLICDIQPHQNGEFPLCPQQHPNRVSHGTSFLAPGSLARRRLARVIHHHQQHTSTGSQEAKFTKVLYYWRGFGHPKGST